MDIIKTTIEQVDMNEQKFRNISNTVLNRN